MTRECFIWSLWALSVFLGVLAVAISTYVLLHTHFAFYEATHANFFVFFVQFVPYLWVIVFVIMMLLAYVNFKNTKYGYRHTMLKIFLTSTLLSLAGGSLVHIAGVGYILDNELGKIMPYRSMEAKELVLWQRPEEGRLVGAVSRRYASTSPMVRFVDTNENVWLITTEDLHQHDLKLLETDRKLRVIGFLRAEGHFHACGVFPWMYSTDVSMSTMAKERELFVERMYAQKDSVSKRALAFEDAVYASSTRPMGNCAEQAVTKRLIERME